MTSSKPVALAQKIASHLRSHFPEFRVSVTRIEDIDARFFATAYALICKRFMDDATHLRELDLDDEVAVIQGVIDGLSCDVLNMSLVHLNAEAIRSKSPSALVDLLEVVDGVLHSLFLLAPHPTSSSSTSPVCTAARRICAKYAAYGKTSLLITPRTQYRRARFGTVQFQPPVIASPLVPDDRDYLRRIVGAKKAKELARRAGFNAARDAAARVDSLERRLLQQERKDSKKSIISRQAALLLSAPPQQAASPRVRHRRAIELRRLRAAAENSEKAVRTQRVVAARELDAAERARRRTEARFETAKAAARARIVENFERARRDAIAAAERFIVDSTRRTNQRVVDKMASLESAMARRRAYELAEDDGARSASSCFDYSMNI